MCHPLADQAFGVFPLAGKPTGGGREGGMMGCFRQVSLATNVSQPFPPGRWGYVYELGNRIDLESHALGARERSASEKSLAGGRGTPIIGAGAGVSRRVASLAAAGRALDRSASCFLAQT